MENQDYLRWLKMAVEDSDIVTELAEIHDKPDEIYDRFYRSLEFGTGGLRGKLGAGSNRMNIYTVRQATKGLAEYLLSNFAKASIAISYDSRHKSQLFATEAAKVLSNCGITVNIFDRLMPTPALSFAVRHLGCSAGVMITASHNPAVYNGYKVYGQDGCQITEKVAESITRSIAAVDIFDNIIKPVTAIPVIPIPESLCEEYYKIVLAQRVDEISLPDALSIIYTPLNGTGLTPVTEVLKRGGYSNVTLVDSQRLPDGNFPTCPYPNPELPDALQEGIKLCREKGADILLATDPDCDRVGVAVPYGNEYRILSGNEIGVLLFDYICKSRKRGGTMPQNPVAVKTIVTTGMAEKIATQYEVALMNVLTGFKYIGEMIGNLEEAGETGRFIFGFEESCGYLSGTYVRDKDAVNACLLICDMAAFYKSKGMTLADAMDSLYEKHGYHKDCLLSHEFEGEAGALAIREFMADLRAYSKNEILGVSIRSKKDYLNPDVHAVNEDKLPSSDVLQFYLNDDTRLTFRPSGTEPKLKIYCSVVRSNPSDAIQALDVYVKLLKEMIQRCP